MSPTQVSMDLEAQISRVVSTGWKKRREIVSNRVDRGSHIDPSSNPALITFSGCSTSRRCAPLEPSSSFPAKVCNLHEATGFTRVTFPLDKREQKRPVARIARLVTCDLRRGVNIPLPRHPVDAVIMINAWRNLVWSPIEEGNWRKSADICSCTSVV